MFVRQLIDLLQNQDPEREVYIAVSIFHAREISAMEKRTSGLVSMSYKPIDIEPSPAIFDTVIRLENPKPEPEHGWWQFWK